MGEGVRLARTPLPELLRELSADCGEEAVGFFRAVSQAAGGGEDLPRVWRERAETLTLEPWDRSAISDLGGDLQGDEEKVCKAISHGALVFLGGAVGDVTGVGETQMDVDLIFKIAAIGILVAVLNQLLVRSGREEQAMMTTLAGLVVVLMMMVQEISDLFNLIKTLFNF